KSPNGNLCLQFSLTKEGTPQYALQYKGKQVIKESCLGLSLQKIPSMIDGFTLVEVKQSLVDSVWYPVWGEQKQIRDNHRELFVLLKQSAVKGREIGIRFRLFDDGLGFRYEFPKQNSLSHFVIAQEQTQFNLAGDHTAYWIPGDYDTNEYLYTTCKISKMRSLQKQATIFIQDQCVIKNLSTQTPLMLKSDDGLYINIHEAGLIDYPAMCLNVNDTTFSLSSHIVPDAANSRGYMQTDCKTPWRTIVVSDKATDILASKLILNLNEPCAYAQTDWIKPMKYIGVWWEYFLGLTKWSYTFSNNVKLDTDYTKLKPHGLHGATTDNVKKYIDFAAENGFSAVLVEGWNIGWERYSFLWKEENFDYITPYPDFDVQALRDYAAMRGVKIMMHHETASSVSNYERRMKDAFQFMVDNGYNSVKTGYVGAITPRGEHHDSQWMVNHYARVARLAADYKIMVNSHEAVRPTGLCRTYPN
ncbi:MAG: glycoside hydrolase family 97 N-terminal domain-containing protein, partial [Bacteroides sp.]